MTDRSVPRLAALTVATLLVASVLLPVGFVGSATAGNADGGTPGGGIGDAPIVSASSPFAAVGGQSATVDVRLWDVPESGLGAYTVVLTVGNGTVASATGATAGAAFGSVSVDRAVDDGRSIRLSAADRNDSVVGGEGNVTLATVELALHADGDTAVSVAVDRLDDDAGDAIRAATIHETLTVVDADAARNRTDDEGGDGSSVDRAGDDGGNGSGGGESVGGGVAEPADSTGSTGSVGSTDATGSTYATDDAGVTVGSGGALGVRSLAADPTAVRIGESVSVDVTVSNTDVIRHERTLTLAVDGAPVAETRVNLASGDRRTVSFDYEPATPGERTLSVGERRVTVAVEGSANAGPSTGARAGQNGTAAPTPTATSDGTTGVETRETRSTRTSETTGTPTAETASPRRTTAGSGAVEAGAAGVAADDGSTSGSVPGFGAAVALLALLAAAALGRR